MKLSDIFYHFALIIHNLLMKFKRRKLNKIFNISFNQSFSLKLHDLFSSKFTDLTTRLGFNSKSLGYLCRPEGWSNGGVMSHYSFVKLSYLLCGLSFYVCYWQLACAKKIRKKYSNQLSKKAIVKSISQDNIVSNWEFPTLPQPLFIY